METIVPENPGSSDELETLVMKLAGHKAFDRCRGEMSMGFIHIIDDLVRHSNSRDEARTKLREFLGASLIMGNTLAQLHFSGKKRAYYELERALTTDDFVFTHEVVPLEKTRPVTILMLEPTKTLVLLQWMAEARTAELNRVIGMKGQRGDIPIQDITLSLFAAFPTLLKRAQERSVSDPSSDGSELLPAFKDATAGLPDTFACSLPLITDNMGHLLHSTESGGCGSTFTFPIAWMFPGKDQAEVLGLFDRKDQARVATWQMHVPEISLRYNGGFRDIKIGFHPEHEHAIWQKKAPAFISSGISHSHGTLFHSYSLTIDTLREYRNEIWHRIVRSEHSWESGPTEIKEGCRPRILTEVRAERHEIESVRVVLGHT